MEKEPKKMKWIRFRVAKELHEMFKRAAELDNNSRSLAHFAQLSMQERSSWIFDEVERRGLHDRIQTTPTEEEDES